MDAPENPDIILIKAALRAAKNALIYGYKIRFVHAIAVQLLTLKWDQSIGDQFAKKLVKSVRLALDHGKVLATFALIYKSLSALLTILSQKTMKHKAKELKGVISFISGFVGGLVVYGGLINQGYGNLLNDRILTQITLYTLSRTILAIGKYMALKAAGNARGGEKVNGIENIGSKLGTGLIWGTVMMFYAVDRKYYLQRSLRLSMDFIYGNTLYSWMDAFNYGK